MKKLLGIYLILSFVLMSFPALAGTQYAYCDTPTKDGSAYVRKVAGEGQPIVGAAKYGDKLIVLSRGNTWHKVRVVRTGVEGYMYGKYIRFAEYVNDYEYTGGNTDEGWGTTGNGGWGIAGNYVPDASVKDADEVLNVNATVRSSDGYANLRWGPGMEYNVMGQLYNGTAVWALEKNGTWIRCVTKDGKIGYISKGLLKLDSKTADGLNGKTAVIRSKDGFAAVRAGAGTDHAMLYQLYVGDKTNAYSSTGQWVRVENMNGWGGAYIHRSLMRFHWNAVTTGNVNIRKGPGTSYGKLGVAYPGMQIKLLATDGNFARVDTGSSIAYMSVRYLNY